MFDEDNEFGLIDDVEVEEDEEIDDEGNDVETVSFVSFVAGDS